MSFSRCSRFPVRDGFCKQHHPDNVQARRKAIDDKWAARAKLRDENNRRYQERERRRDLADHWFDQMEEALREYHALVLEYFGEFDGEECGEKSLCPKCKAIGCINLKIRAARAILAGIEKERGEHDRQKD